MARTPNTTPIDIEEMDAIARLINAVELAKKLERRAAVRAAVAARPRAPAPPQKAPPPPPPLPPPTAKVAQHGNKADLLKQIRAGTNLKPTEVTPRREKQHSGLLGTLQENLKKRRDALESDDESPDEAMRPPVMRGYHPPPMKKEKAPPAPVYKNGLFDVSSDDWKSAEQYFKNNPTAVKFEKKDAKNKISCSFINVGGEIYAKKTGDCLGQGGVGKIKIVQNRQGDNFAVKIEGKGIHEENRAEKEIMRELGRLHGTAVRPYGKRFKDVAVYQESRVPEKSYTVMPLYNGKNLFDTVTDQSKKLSDLEKLTLAKACVAAIKELHDRGIIHADIKPENFMVIRQGNSFTVAAIDFGFSLKLEKNQDRVEGPARGTINYTAPEIVATGVFSKASDMYALGSTLDDLEIDAIIGPEMLNQLLDDDPKKRPTTDAVLKVLDKAIARLQAPAPKVASAPVPQRRPNPIPPTAAAPVVPQRRPNPIPPTAAAPLQKRPLPMPPVASPARRVTPIIAPRQSNVPLRTIQLTAADNLLLEQINSPRRMAKSLLTVQVDNFLKLLNTLEKKGGLNMLDSQHSATVQKAAAKVLEGETLKSKDPQRSLDEQGKHLDNIKIIHRIVPEKAPEHSPHRRP